jgi:hypothetical protein
MAHMAVTDDDIATMVATLNTALDLASEIETRLLDSVEKTGVTFPHVIRSLVDLQAHLQWALTGPNSVASMKGTD